MASYASTRVYVEGTVAAAPYMAMARERFERGELDERWLTGQPVPAAADAPPAGIPVGGKWWSHRDILLLRQELHYHGVKALFAVCAREAGEWVPKKKADDEAGYDSGRQLASELGALTKLTRRLFGRDDWPIQYKKVANQYAYFMSAEVAEVWLS